MLQVAVAGDVDIQVALELFVDVHQRRRRFHPRLHGKAQAMGLTLAVIRVLANHHYLDLSQRRGVERIEYQRTRRINLLACGFLGPQKVTQLAHIGLLELFMQSGLPASFEFDVICSAHAGFLLIPTEAAR